MTDLVVSFGLVAFGTLLGYGLNAWHVSRDRTRQAARMVVVEEDERFLLADADTSLSFDQARIINRASVIVRDVVVRVMSDTGTEMDSERCGVLLPGESIYVTLAGRPVRSRAEGQFSIDGIRWKLDVAGNLSRMRNRRFSRFR